MRRFLTEAGVKTMMNYKGYRCTIRFDDEAEIFHGEVTGLRDVCNLLGKDRRRIEGWLFVNRLTITSIFAPHTGGRAR